MDCIDEFSSQGEFHSSGTFTLSVSESRARLSQYQLEEGLFLAKWIQAGVGLDCQKIRVEVGQRLSLTLLGHGHCKLRMDNLIEHLDSPLQLAGGSPESALALGLLASQQGGPNPLTVHLKDPEGGMLIQVLAGEARSHRTPSSGHDWSLQISLTHRFEHDFEALIRQRCGYCPVAIEMNNRLLESPWDNPGEEQYRVAEAYLEGDASRLHLPEPGRRASWCVLEGGHYTERHSPEPRAFLLCYPGPGARNWDTALAVSARLQGPSRLQWVKGGVVIEEEEVDLGTPGMLGVVSAHYLETDLSQFKLLRNAAYQARLALLREQSDHLMRSVLGCPLPVRVPARASKSVEDWIQSTRR